MKEYGWLKIHRKILESKFSRNMEMMGFWLYVLAKAYHKPTPNKYGVVIPAGSFDSGRKQISLETGLSESKVERFLKKLEIEHQIEQQKTTKYRIISITKWSEYQTGEQQSEQQANNKRTTSEQQVNTLKECNNTNNVNKYIIPLSDGDLDLKSFPEIWKTHFSSRPLKAFSDTRIKKLKSAIKNHGLDTNKKLNNYLAFCASLDWMNGRTPKRWFAGFDFLFRPDTLAKVQEGSYGQINDELEPVSQQPKDDEDLIAFFEEKLNGI